MQSVHLRALQLRLRLHTEHLRLCSLSGKERRGEREEGRKKNLTASSLLLFSSRE